MDPINKITVLAAECSAGGGGFRAFAPKMVAELSDYNKTLLANCLADVMPSLDEKFRKITPETAWFISLCAPGRWRTNVLEVEFHNMFRTGINRATATPGWYDRTLKGLLERLVPGHEIVQKWDGEDMDAKKVDWFKFPELDDVRASVLAVQPNAIWPPDDEEGMKAMAAAEAEALALKAEEKAHTARLRETWPEVQGWDHETYAALSSAERALERAKSAMHLHKDDGGRGAKAVSEAQSVMARAKAADEAMRAAMWARQKMQMQRIKDGLPLLEPGVEA